MLLRRMLIMLAVVVLVVLALAAYKGYSIYQQVQLFSAPPPPISVEAEPAREIPWQRRLPAIGTLKAIQGVELTVEVPGTVQQTLFESGQKVSQDQPLIQMSSEVEDRKSTRLNSSHVKISYAVFCLKKKSRECLRYRAGPTPT